MKLTLPAAPALLLLLAGSLSDAARLPLSRSSSSSSNSSPDDDSYLNSALPPTIFHNLGTYSPRYAVPSSLSEAIPAGCSVTLVNSLERHGARYMTSGAHSTAASTLSKVAAALADVSAAALPADLRFLKENATLLDETADLNPYGAVQAYESGRYTAERYASLARESGVFVRTTGTEESDRVIVTAQYWAQGYHGGAFPSSGKLTNGTEVRAAGSAFTHQPDVIISEADGRNNTLDVSTCAADESYNDASGEDGASKAYGQSTLEPVIAKRLDAAFAKAGVQNLSLTYTDVLNFAYLCSFETLGRASASGGAKLTVNVSDYCGMFTDAEWDLIEYAGDAGKFYGSGYGDPFHRGIATGYLRELLARLSASRPALDPPTAMNTTLDAANGTFPTPARGIFFDGSHDNNISPIAAAFGLFQNPGNASLSLGANAQASSEAKERRWRFSQIAPMQGKIVWEKLACNASGSGSGSGKGEYVRVIANGAVQPAKGASWCPTTASGSGSESLLGKGLCPLESVEKALAWTKSAEEWEKCYQ